MMQKPATRNSPFLIWWREITSSRFMLDVWRVLVGAVLVYLSVHLAKADPFWLNYLPARPPEDAFKPIVETTHPLYYVIGFIPSAYLVFAVIRSLREFGRSSKQPTIKQ